MPNSPYVVQQGDTIMSIAYAHGLDAQSVWNAPENADLKRKRPNPNLLLPGDIVHLRDLEGKEVSCSTEKRHRFRVKGRPAKIHIRLLDRHDRARANLRYVLVVDHTSFSGSTNSDGEFQHPIPPDARTATLHLPATGERFDIGVGHQDPLDTDTGVAGRLHNIGLMNSANPADLERGLRRFQSKMGLSITGQLDDATRQKLREVYGH